MGRGLRRHFCAAVAGNRGDGRHVAGDAAHHGAAQWHRRAGHRGALCVQHDRRRAGCAGLRVLAGAAVRLGPYGGGLCSPQPRLRRRGVAAVGGATGRRGAGPVHAQSEAGRADAPVRQRAARHRLRSAGRAGAEPGGGGHGLHLRHAAGGVPGRHGRRRRRVPALAGRCAPPRPRARPACFPAGGDLPARRREPVGRRAVERHRAARARPRHGARAGRRSHAGTGRVRIADDGDGRAVQPPRHAGARRRHRRGPCARRQHGRSRACAAAVRRVAGAPRRAEVRVADDRGRLSGDLVARGVACTRRLGAGRGRGGAGRLGAAAGFHRPAGRRARAELPRRPDGRRERRRRRRRRGSPAHQQPAARRQQRHAAGRCAAGIAAALVASAAEARAVSRLGHRHDGVVGHRRSCAAGRCRGTAAGSHRSVRAFHQGVQ